MDARVACGRLEHVHQRLHICMSQEENKLSIENIAARLTMLGRKLRRARMLSSRTEELLDDVTREFDDLQGMVGRSITSTPNSSQVPRPGIVSRRRSRFPPESPPGVISVILVQNPGGPDGSEVGRIDGRPGIPFPPFVAALLDVLKADCGSARDHLVGWKSIAAIQLALKERTKQNHSRKAVKELIYRLRNLLELHGENPFLVQNKPGVGYRIAVLRRIGTMTERENH